MVKTTQEYLDGAAARFQADNADDDTVKTAWVTQHQELAALYRATAARARRNGRVMTAAVWERAADDIDSGSMRIQGE